MAFEMDRRSADLLNQFQKLQAEHYVASAFLQRLLDMNYQHLNNFLGTINYATLSSRSKYFLDVTKCMSMNYQKLLEINITLEEHFQLLEMNPLITDMAIYLPKEVTDETKFKILEPNFNTTNSATNSSFQEITTPEITNKEPKDTNKTVYSFLKNTINHIMFKNSKNNASNEINLPPSKLVNETELKEIDLDFNNINKTDFNTNSYDLNNEESKLITDNVNNTVSTDSLLLKTTDETEKSLNINCDLNNSIDSLSPRTIISQENDKTISPLLQEPTCPSQTTFNNFSNEKSDKLETSDMFSVSITDSEFLSCTSDLSENEKQNKCKEVAEEHLDLKQSQSLDNVTSLSEQLKLLPVMSVEEKFIKCLSTTYTTSSLDDVEELESILSLSENIDTLKDEIIMTVNDNTVEQLPIEDTKPTIPSYYNDLKINDVCGIGCIVSPFEIYIQVARAGIDKLDELSKILEEDCIMRNSIFVTKDYAMNEIGSFGCVEYGGMYYRVEILDWMMSTTNVENDKDKVYIQLVDYGNKLKVHFSKLQPISKDACSIEKIAQRCHLAYLYPPGSTKFKVLKEWPEKSIDALRDICSDDSFFRLTYVCKGSDSFAVDMVNIDAVNSEKTVIDILIEMDLAVDFLNLVSEILTNNKMVKQIRYSHGLEGIKQDMSDEEIIEKFFEKTPKEAKTLSEAIMSYEPRDEAETCIQFLKGYCKKGKNCKFRHVKLRGGYTRDKEEVYIEPSEYLILPDINEEVTLLITHVLSIQRFYAVIRSGDNTNNAQTLNGLRRLMNSSACKERYKLLDNPPALGQLVIAKHWNKQWYRAQVQNVDIPGNDDDVTVEVFFVDYGDTLTLSIMDVRLMTKEFLSLPFQAIECRIHNVKHKNGLDPEDEKQYFQQNFVCQEFQAKVMAVSGHLEVLLFNSHGEDVGLKIINAGYGELNTEHEFPHQNEVMLVD